MSSGPDVLPFLSLGSAVFSQASSHIPTRATSLGILVSGSAFAPTASAYFYISDLPIGKGLFIFQKFLSPLSLNKWNVKTQMSAMSLCSHSLYFHLKETRPISFSFSRRRALSFCL